MKTMFLSLALIAIGCTHAPPASPSVAATQPIMDRYIELMRHPDGPQKQAALDLLTEELQYGLVIRPAREMRVTGIITDEEGRPLDGVQALVVMDPTRTLANLLDPPKKTRKLILAREFDFKPDRYPRITIEFSKPGYVTAGMFFSNEGPSHDSGILQRMLAPGGYSYIVPRSDGRSGLHVVMYSAHHNWDPAGDGEFFSPDRAFWPKKVPPGLQALVSSDAPQMIAAPETGTYVATDVMGNVLDLVRLRKGMIFGFDPDYGTASYMGTGANFSTKKGPKFPYSWYLYSRATPIYPATQRATGKDSDAK